MDVLVSVLPLAGGVGVLMACWRVLRAERRDRNAGAAPWPWQRRWKRGGVLFLTVTALASVVLLLSSPFLLRSYLIAVSDWDKSPRYGSGIGGYLMDPPYSGLPATFVLIVWLVSVMLAVRALWRGQSGRWPVVVLALCALEAAVVGLLVFWARAGPLGFALVVPVFVLASVVGALVAWWRVQRAQKRDRNAGANPWTWRRRLERGLVWYLAVTALVSAILLPCPLFLVYASGYQKRGPQGFQKWLVERTPIVLGEATAILLSSFSSPNRAQVLRLYHSTLLSGRVAPARLLSELNSTNADTQFIAFIACWDFAPAAALDCATGVADGKIPGFSGFSSVVIAGHVLADLGSAEQIRPYLDPARAPQPPYQFMRGMMQPALEKHPELLPDLERFCRVDTASRAEALMILARFAPPERVQVLWAEFLADSDPLRRAPAVSALGHIPDANARLKIKLAALDSRNQALQREILTNTTDGDVLYFADSKLLARYLKALLPFLEGQDLGLRRAVTWRLFAATPAGLQLLEKWRRPLNQAAPGIPAEQELVKKVREITLKWLEKNDK